MRLRIRQATAHDLWQLSHFADCHLSPKALGLAAFDSMGRLRGCVAYDEPTADSCRVHQAGTPISVRALLPLALTFPFEVLGVAKLVGTVASTNVRALRFNTHLGFREVAREADGFGDGVAKVHMELRREDCRFLRRKEAA